MCPINVSARCALSRIVSRIALSGVSDSATASIRDVADYRGICGRVSPKIVASELSCSVRHISRLPARREKIDLLGDRAL